MDSAAIFGFAGVLVGAGSTYVAQRGAESRQSRANARVGVRLMAVEIVDIKATLEIALESEEWWAEANSSLMTSTWEGNKAALANSLLLDDWVTVQHAYAVVDAVEKRAKREIEAERPAIDDSDREKVKKVISRLEKAQDVLIRLTVEMQTSWERAKARRAKRINRG